MAGHLVLLFADALEEQHVPLNMDMGCRDLPNAWADLRSLHVKRFRLFELTKYSKAKIDILREHSRKETIRFCSVFTTIVPFMAANT